MKRSTYFLVLIIFVCGYGVKVTGFNKKKLKMSPLKLEAKALLRPPSIDQNRQEPIANLIYPPIQKIESNLYNDNYEDQNSQTIPVYLIMSSKSNVRTESQKTSKYAKLFDDKGMIYITKPKAARNGQHRISILDDIKDAERRSYSSYNLTRKNQKQLKSFVNQELNKKLIAKNAMRRFLDKYDKEYNFNDLVM